MPQAGLVRRDLMGSLMAFIWRRFLLVAFAPVQPANRDGHVGARHYRTLAKRRSLSVIQTRVASMSVSHCA